MRKNFSFKLHKYHLVDPSPWPFITAIAAFCVATGLAMFMHRYVFGNELLFFSLFFLLGSMGFWWRDVIREGTYEGKHTLKVQKGLKLGFFLFIVSEVMFFFAFFWAFFHSSLATTPALGCIWPPEGLQVFSPFGVPLLNTYLLVSSGVMLTASHQAILLGDKDEAIDWLFWTLIFAFLFTFLQYVEYVDAPFTIADGVYGSTFFLSTGFHGLHVLIGSSFLFVCLIRLFWGQFTKTHHLGFEVAAWYWHFVDVVWLFLFVMVYWWGGFLDFDNDLLMFEGSYFENIVFDVDSGSVIEEQEEIVNKKDFLYVFSSIFVIFVVVEQLKITPFLSIYKIFLNSFFSICLRVSAVFLCFLVVFYFFFFDFFLENFYLFDFFCGFLNYFLKVCLLFFCCFVIFHIFYGFFKVVFLYSFLDFLVVFFLFLFVIFFVFLFFNFIFKFIIFFYFLFFIPYMFYNKKKKLV